MYKVIYTFYFKNGRKMKTTYEDIVSASELDYIKSNKGICIISVTKTDKE